MPTRKLCIALFWTGTVLQSQERIHAQDVVVEDVREFDAVQIAAIALGLGIDDITNTLQPPPSAALRSIVILRPQLLLTTDGGGSWLIRLQRKKGVFKVNREKHNLKPSDLATIDLLLDNEYLSRWITCMRDAWIGRGSRECVVKLAEVASNEPPDVRMLVGANLGARLLALADQNREWRGVVYGDSTPQSITDSIVAFRKLETEKIKSVFAHGKTSEPSFDGIVKASDRGEITWFDFQAATPAQGKRHPWGKNIKWSVAQDSGKVHRVSDWSKTEMCTLPLSSDQHIILKGNLAASIIQQLDKARTVRDLVRQAQAAKIDVFLSRPGSQEVGLYSPH